MVEAFCEICEAPCGDGIVFEPSSVRDAEIHKSAGYGGVRIDVPAVLDGARISLQVDIGFGDAVTPGPQAVRYPVLLDGLSAPELRAYLKATVIAEKLHAGFGAGVLSTGDGTTLVLDGARVHTHGAIRTGVVADKGSHLIVKNSTIRAEDGVLPADYKPSVDVGSMKSVPWMLGLSGTNRATNLVGDNTQETFINSSVTAQNWGALSNDVSSKVKLTVIASKVSVSGKSGYGMSSLGGATTRVVGSTVDVPDLGVIVDTGGNHVQLGASSPEVVAGLNAELGLGLTAAELKAIPVRPTVVHAGHSAVMLHESIVIPSPPNSLRIDGAELEAGESVILNKGVPADIVVDGARGAKLHSRKGVLVQVMQSDDPGPVLENGSLRTTAVYHEPSTPPTRVAGFDAGEAHAIDVNIRFADIKLEGDLFNGYRDGIGSKMGVNTPAAGKNLVVKLERSSLAGVVSSTDARHAKDTIGSADYALLGVVTNTPAAAINNGAILSLTASTWTVTGRSFLTHLTLDAASRITAPAGSTLTMTVDGKEQPIQAGDFKGEIVLTLHKA